MYRSSTEIELDECGFHAVIADEVDDVLHITDSYNTAEDAARAARAWIARNEMPNVA